MLILSCISVIAMAKEEKSMNLGYQTLEAEENYLIMFHWRREFFSSQFCGYNMDTLPPMQNDYNRPNRKSILFLLTLLKII